VKEGIRDMMFTTSLPAELLTYSQTYVCYVWQVSMSKETNTFCKYGG